VFALASSARAELIVRGDLFVRFAGGIAPTALPRHAPAPVEVRVSSTVRVLSGNHPPPLRRITIALNGAGHLDSRGLPRCPVARIRATDDLAALAACRSALVGEGRYRATAAYPEQTAFPSQGRILAFNAIVGGRRAILAHVHGGDPVQTFIVVFRIRSGTGTYGTTLTGSLPKSTNPYGSVTHFSLDLHRNYTYLGHRHSYISAACAAPPGFTRAIFPFARVSMSFEDGRTLSSSLSRSCRVRG